MFFLFPTMFFLEHIHINLFAQSLALIYLQLNLQVPFTTMFLQGKAN